MDNFEDTITLWLVGRSKDEAKNGFLWSDYADALQYMNEEFADFEKAKIWTITARLDLGSIELSN